MWGSELSFLGELFHIPSPVTHRQLCSFLRHSEPSWVFQQESQMSHTLKHTHKSDCEVNNHINTHTHRCECLSDIRHKEQRIIFAPWKRHSLHAISPVTLTRLCVITLRLNVSRQPWNICMSPHFIFMWWDARRCHPLSHTHKTRPYHCTAVFCHKHTFRRMQLSVT